MKPVVEAAVRYLRQHPEELLRAARGAVGLRLGVPIDFLRWMAGRIRGGKAPRDLEIEAVPPGLRLGATLELMGNVVRASAVVYVERVGLCADEWRVEVRLSDVRLKLLEEAPDSPLATLLKSGALDLSRPGTLAAYMPKRPAMLVDALDDRIVLDLMKHPKLHGNHATAKKLGLLSTLLAVRSIATDDAHLDVALRAFPEGLDEAWGAVRELF